MWRQCSMHGDTVQNTNPPWNLLCCGSTSIKIRHLAMGFRVRVLLGKVGHHQRTCARSAEGMGPRGVWDGGEENSCYWNKCASLLVEVGCRGCQRGIVKNSALSEPKGVSRNLWMPWLPCWIACQMVWPVFSLRALNPRCGAWVKGAAMATTQGPTRTALNVGNLPRHY